MSVTPFAPLGNLATLSTRLSRLRDEMASPAEGREPAARVWRPATDVWEDERHVTVVIDLPGVTRESIDVQFRGDTLTVRGERAFDRQEAATYLHLGRPHGEFRRSFTLNVPVEADNVSASFKDGVLTVTLPKADVVRPRKIAVASENGAH